MLLVFAGTTQLNANNNSAANTEYAGITFNAGAGAFVLGGNAINLAGDVVNNSTNLQTINIESGDAGEHDISTPPRAIWPWAGPSAERFR